MGDNYSHFQEVKKKKKDQPSRPIHSVSILRMIGVWLLWVTYQITLEYHTGVTKL
jgi:hypothetical protein